ncbi:MAG: saccharopine dehydrogenase NADP-binding domain-containing protein [Enterobacterales bacterium]|nr:saccharopine dehydrogenase NADP-binding domain-containing protein [Enterobacterales bacterium]
MKQKQLMIYGANGYTGQLIAKQAVEKGFKPVLAGRNTDALNQLAEQLNLPVQVFSLVFETEIIKNLENIDLVIHCAGPFSATAEPMMHACLKSACHYTDITGEIEVFELAQSLDQEAKKANVILCPGVGFDVVPTDCLAQLLKQKMPDATHLALGFDSGSKMSPGTAKTSVEGIAGGGRIRKDGKITQVPLAYKQKSIDFGRGEKNAVTIPWGDVSTAYHSTGIPNIEVYIPMSPKGANNMKKMNWFRWLVKLKFIQNKMKAQMAKVSTGPDEKQRESLRTFLWGQVENAEGKTLTARLETANGYQLTYLAAVEIAQKILQKNPKGGAYTPSLLLGSDLIFKIPATGEVSFSED